MSERKTTIADIIGTAERAAFCMALQPDDHVAKCMRRVRAALAGQRVSLENEKQTQGEIALALGAAGVLAFREVPIAGGVIDFVAEFGEVSLATGRNTKIGIEVKLKGQPKAILRQIEAYAADPSLAGLVLVTAKAMPMPSEIGGKPLAVLDLGRAWL